MLQFLIIHTRCTGPPGLTDEKRDVAPNVAGLLRSCSHFLYFGSDQGRIVTS